MKKTGQQIVPITLPTRGLDESSSFSDMDPRYSSFCQNVRPADCQEGRRRLSRRPGTSKYVTTRISTASIQEIAAAIITQDQTLGTGELFGQAKTTSGPDSIAFFTKAAGTEGSKSTALLSTDTMGCVDENGNFYVAAISSGSVQLKKFGTDHILRWTTTLTVTGSGMIFGLAAFNGVLYLYLTDDVSLPGLHRYETETGSKLEAAAWLNSTLGLANIAAGQTKCYQHLSCGGNILGVVGGKTGNLILQQIDVTSGIITHETTIETFATYPSKLINDAGGNFYVLTNVAGGAVNRLAKITWSGALDAIWPVNPVVSAGQLAQDISYDPVGYRIGVVGTTLFGTTDSFETFDASTGSRLAVTNPQPGGQTTWAAIAADGYGSFKVRRSAATNDISSFSPAWTVTSSLGATTTRTIWAVSPGLNLTSPGTPMQSRRSVRSVAVAGGSLIRFDTGTPTTVTANFCSGAAPVVFSTRNIAIPSEVGVSMYFCDGSSYPYWNASSNTVGILAATAGAVPSSPNGAKCRLNCTWAGRLVMAGLLDDPQLLFASAVGNPADWNYGQFPVLETQAFAAAPAAQLGLPPDSISGLVSYSDDTLIVGCDHSIYRLSGNPISGGRFDAISTTVGMAFGRAFCMDPAGNLYFFSQSGSVYAMTASSRPQRISQPIDDARLFNIDLSQHIIRMEWDDWWRGFHLFITPIDASEETTHYWWDSQTDKYSTIPGSWWPDVFGNVSHNPMATYVFDGDDPEDRVVLMGGRDGYVRQWDNEAEWDDGSVIESILDIGPIRDSSNMQLLLNDMQAVMASDSAGVAYAIRTGESVEASFLATTRETGTFSAGRNRSQAIRARGASLFVRLSAAVKAKRWSLESLTGIVEMRSGINQRIW